MAELEALQFHFLRPWWLAALPLLLALAWWYLRRRRSRSGWERHVDPSLLRVLLDREHTGGHRWLAPALIAAVTAAVIGLAGPSWERIPQPVDERSDALVIVLDLSDSMRAGDLEPSRVERARLKIADMLRERAEGQTGLVAFAGDAHIVTPLTDDTATIENLLPHLSPDIMPLAGRNTEHGVRLARQLFDNAGAQQGRILLVTDGVRNIESVARHAGRNFPISILGAGTREGTRVAPGDGRGAAPPSGVVRLQSDRLQRLARLGHGRYSDITVDDADIRHLLATPLPLPADAVRVDREFDSWIDRGYVLALLLLPLALLGFRRGALLGLCLIAVTPLPVQAGIWEGLWRNADQQGYEALDKGESERAARLFNDPLWTGVAHYRAGDYEAAESWFAADPTARGHYNRGNALALQGRVQDAIAAYDEALALDATHEDAAFNRKLLEELQREREAEQAASAAGPPQMGIDGEPEQPRPGDGESARQPGRAPSDDDYGMGHDDDPLQDHSLGLRETNAGRAGEEQAQRERRDPARLEEDQALEQWLRRVPDDPGGLLRRKFRQETDRRLREGELQRRREEAW